MYGKCNCSSFISKMTDAIKDAKPKLDNKKD